MIRLFRRRTLLAAVGAAIAALAAGAATLVAEDDGGKAAASPAATTSTVRAERRDLVERESFDGTLGFADSRALLTGRPGTVTWLRAEGSLATRGQRLYEIDGRSTFLLYGDRPTWGTLAKGARGRDVRQLEQSLVAMGYDPKGKIRVDRKFEPATEAAVKR